MIGIDLQPTAEATLRAVRAECDLSPWADQLWETALMRDPLEMCYARHLWWEMGILTLAADRRLLTYDLPTAKMIVRWVRYTHIAALWEREDRVEIVARRMGYATWKSFDQHLRIQFGIGATEMRDTIPYPMAREQLLDAMVRPYRYDWSLVATGPYFARPASRRLEAA